jgi:hypothetical protein
MTEVNFGVRPGVAGARHASWRHFGGKWRAKQRFRPADPAQIGSGAAEISQ